MEIEKRAAFPHEKTSAVKSLHDHRAPCNWWHAPSPKIAIRPTAATNPKRKPKAKLAQPRRWHVLR
jgi:hypothetical protein